MLRACGPSRLFAIAHRESKRHAWEILGPTDRAPDADLSTDTDCDASNIRRRYPRRVASPKPVCPRHHLNGYARNLSGVGLCQPPSAAINASASLGPQL